MRSYNNPELDITKMLLYTKTASWDVCLQLFISYLRYFAEVFEALLRLYNKKQLVSKHVLDFVDTC